MLSRTSILLLAALLLSASAWAQTDKLALDSQRARQLMAEGRFSDALPIYEQLLRAMPGNAGLRLNLAMALHFSGQDDKAIPQFEAVLKQQPGTLPALMLLGATYLRTGQPAKAVSHLEKAVALAPNDVEGRSMLVDALLMLDRYEAAIPHLRKLTIAQHDNPRAWYGLGRAYEFEAQRAFGSLGKQQVDSPWWLALAAEVRLKEGKYTAAFALYRAVLEKKPGFRGAHLGLAEVYRKTNHPDWAAKEDEREKKLGLLACPTPTAACLFAKANYERTLIAARASNTAESLYWRSRAANELAAGAFAHLAKLPPSAEFRQFSAEVYRNQGRYADSIQEWQEAIRLSPDDPQLKLELATTIYLNRDYAGAEKMARDLLAQDPNAADLQFILGDSLMNQQRPEEAIGPLIRAIGLRKDYATAHAVLGRALLQLDRSGDAIPHLKAALPSDTDGSLYFQLSRAYQGAGQQALAEQARQTYQKIRQTSAPADISISAPDK